MDLRNDEILVLFRHACERAAEFSKTHTLGGAWSEYDRDFSVDLNKMVGEIQAWAKRVGDLAKEPK